MSAEETLEERSFGSATVLFGARGGKYPHGNSILVQGKHETAIVDPSLGVVARDGGGDGDAWSDLEDFERTLRRVRELDARTYATFHHVSPLPTRWSAAAWGSTWSGCCDRAGAPRWSRVDSGRSDVVPCAPPAGDPIGRALPPIRSPGPRGENRS
ncbi:MAG: hypothetical protein ABFS46_09315 [Myxococcota bacterium]